MAMAETGVYSLLMFIRHELPSRMGVRLAVGASPRDITGVVLRQSTSYALCGVALSLALLGVVMRSLRAVVYGIVVWDPAVILTYSVFVAVVCIAAASIPAWRGDDSTSGVLHS